MLVPEQIIVYVIMIRSCSSIASFESSVVRRHNFSISNGLYYIGDRLAAVFHTRLRLSNSTLNYDLYSKKLHARVVFQMKLPHISFLIVIDMLLLVILCSPLLLYCLVQGGQILPIRLVSNGSLMECLQRFLPN